jgi:hypothetical protein
LSQAAKKRAGAKTPDSELTPERLKKRADNRRYRANMRKRMAAAGLKEPPHRKRPGNGAAHEQSFPLELIPDRVPSSLRERAPRAHAASIGGFDANKLLVLELARLFNRILDGH